MTTEVSKTEDEWRALLSKEEYAVLRRAGTERPWSGEYVDTKTEGVYRCRACGAELFRSSEKFDSHCGWPSFWSPGDQYDGQPQCESNFSLERNSSAPHARQR